MEINASQFIKRAWRDVEGIRQLVDINCQEEELPNGTNWHIKRLEASIKNGGKAYGCFKEGALIGFAVIDAKIFGTIDSYVLLDQMFISLEYRNKGIGKRLFELCCQEAKNKGANKIYICAGSAEETIAFYFAMGCKEAQEINQRLYKNDIRDYQLEYKL
ncbi:GNAT family N-acetyltransferase [Romboutsia sp.]|uniref:GNAT family N-acetyltransferase n=1 Tax=Romboutsia sp. TaxID=1965302 RepID=UPI002CC53C02|nr:GNAT family N-acetyltransferase [Romboutsia sp.]HSQ87670.1 GNAT family N-acetyltransferase [Romboutsia sp.]